MLIFLLFAGLSLTPAFGWPSVAPETVQMQARKLVRDKKYEPALKKYDSIAEWLRKDPERMIEWARACAYASRHGKAITIFEEVASKYPDRAPLIKNELKDEHSFAVLEHARELVEKKQYGEAIREYDGIAKWLERDAGLVIERARVYAYADRNEEAIALLKEVKANHPAVANVVDKDLQDLNAYVVLGRARQLVEKKQYGRAIKEYDGIAKWLERDPGLVIERARVYAYDDRHAEAIALLEGISAKYPDKAQVIARELEDQKAFVTLERARALVEKKQYGEAIREYDSIAKWLERDPGLLIERARVYTYADRHAEAVRLFEAIVRDHPVPGKDVQKEFEEQKQFIVLKEARDLVERKEYAKAIAVYEKLTALLDRDPGLWLELARVYSYADNHGKAAEIFERVRSQHPGYNSMYLRELGDMYAWQNKLEDAMKIYRLALEKMPDNPDVAAALGRALCWSGKKAEAMKVYEDALKKNPDAASLLVGKADLLSLMDRFSEARKLLEKVLAKEPGNIDALNMKARLMVWDGHHRSGAELYRNILKAVPDNHDALEGLAFAFYWDEREVETVEVLERLLALQPNRKEAARLMYRVKREDNPDVSILGGFFSDSDDRDALRVGASGKMVLHQETRLEALVDTVSISSEASAATNEISGHSFGISIDSRLGNQLRLKIPARISHYDKNSWDVLTTDSSLLWQPADAWLFEGGYERAVIEKVSTILEELTINNVKGRIKWKPDRLWMFSCALNHGDYSDGNRQDALMGIAEYRITQDPYSKIYYNCYFSDWDNEAADYFSPERFSAHTLGLYLSSVLAPSFFVEGQASAGYETQVRRSGPDVNSANMFFAGGLVYRPSESWRISLRCEYFESFADHSVNYDGYRSVMGRLGFTYLFGGALEREKLSAESAPAPGPRDR